MNNTLFVKLEATLSVDEWNTFMDMLTKKIGVNMDELNVINKLQEGAEYDLAPEDEYDLPY